MDERGSSNSAVDEVAITAAIEVLGVSHGAAPDDVTHHEATSRLDRRAWLDLG